MRRLIQLQLILLCLISVSWLLVGCSGFVNHPDSKMGNPTTTSNSTLPTALVEQAQTFLNQETGIAHEQMQLKASESMEWSDACLGVGQSDRLCAQVITPGYRIVLTTPQGEYVVHSDRTGNVMQLAQSP